MSRFLLSAAPLAPLALVAASLGACSSPSAVEEGDALFRVGRYQQALLSYERVGDADDQSEVGQRIRRTRYFVLEDAARDLLHEDRPEDATLVLDAIESVPADREAEVDALRSRARLRMARHAAEDALAALEDERPEDALVAATRALSLDPELEQAAALRARAQREILTDAAAAEAAYLAGLEELQAGLELRARAAFSAALRRAPDDARAATRLEAVTRDLASEMRTMGRLHMQAGELGQAWVALNDAIRLDPDDEQGASLLETLDTRIRAEALLSSADIAVRGGHVDAADAILEELSVVAPDYAANRAAQVAERSRDERNRGDYARARAFELDNQAIRALGLYASILTRESEYGWEDVELRATALERRIGEAATAYDQALTAQRAGDAEAYRTHLEQVLQLAADYGDAMRRYRDLVAPAARPEAEADGGDEGI